MQHFLINVYLVLYATIQSLELETILLFLSPHSSSPFEYDNTLS